MEPNIKEYLNCTVAKLKNRRVLVRNNPKIPNCLIMEFKILDTSRTIGSSITEVDMGKGVHFHGMTISHEAAAALISCLQSELIRYYKTLPDIDPLTFNPTY